MTPRTSTTTQPTYEYAPVTLSIETAGGISTPVLRRGTPLPYTRNQRFSTATDNQKSVEIHLQLGERPLAKYNVPIGNCMLNDIPPAKSGEPEIRVTFSIDKFYNVEIQALEKKSGVRVDAAFQRSQIKLTNGLVSQLISDARKHKIQDDAELTIAEANLRVQKDHHNNIVTSATTNIEKLISELGIALMEDNPFVRQKTQQLRELLQVPSYSAQPFASGGFGDLFGGLFSPTTPVKPNKTVTKDSVPKSQVQIPEESTTRLMSPSTHMTVLIQTFLEQISPDLESKRAGAWQALESGTQDGPAQASHSMRELLSQVLDNLAPSEFVQKAPWYKKPKQEPAVTRAMKIRYAITGTSDVQSESTLSLINGISEAVNAVYAKLSAESHSRTRLKISKVRMYLFACEAIIGLIATERKS